MSHDEVILTGQLGDKDRFRFQVSDIENWIDVNRGESFTIAVSHAGFVTVSRTENDDDRPVHQK